MQYFYTGLFSYLLMSHGQDQSFVIRSDLYLVTGQKSELIFVVLLLRCFAPKRRKIFIINVAELFSFSQTTDVS